MMSARGVAEGPVLRGLDRVVRLWTVVPGLLLGAALVILLTDALGQRVCGREAVEAQPPGVWILSGCGR